MIHPIPVDVKQLGTVLGRAAARVMIALPNA